MAYTTNSGSSNNTGNIDNFLDKFIAKTDNIDHIELGTSEQLNEIEEQINTTLEYNFDIFVQANRTKI